MISRMIGFLREGLWSLRLKELSLYQASGVKVLRVIILAVRGFLRDGCPRNASVLTYYSLLNIVPIFAVVFGVAKGFGLERLIEREILQIAQKANWQAEITTRLLGFSHSLLEHAQGGLIAGIGVILLFWTVISILGKIEGAFNEIWEVKRSRSLVRKFSDYLAMVVSAPILFVISSSVTVLVSSQVKGILEKAALFGTLSDSFLFLLGLMPYVSVWILFSLLYLVMPNTKVSVRSGALAGITAGTLFQIVQWFYIRFQIGVTRYGAIYGSFAALPLFLAWLQASWMIVLLGAEIACASERYETFGFGPDQDELSPAARKLLALRIFHLLIGRFARGERALSAKEIALVVEIPVRLTNQLLGELIEARLIAEAVSPGKHEAAYLPARSVEELTLADVLEALEERGSAHLPAPDSEEGKRIRTLLEELSKTLRSSSANVRIKEI